MDEARDSRFPAWRKLDVKNWNRANLWPGALTIMPMRFTLILIVFFISFIFIGVIFSCDLPKSGKPIAPWRLAVKSCIFTVTLRLIFAILGVQVTISEDKKADYRKWLGPEGNSPKATRSGKFSTYIMNHSGFLDMCLFNVVTNGNVCGVSADQYQKMWGVNFACQL
jgi:1-acyl-sn-glycerol-3-phosphate acyltransferase